VTGYLIGEPKKRKSENYLLSAPDIYPTNTVPKEAHVGSVALWDAVQRAKPKVHAFGHIHHSYGRAERSWYNGQEHLSTLFLNVAICNEQYKPVNQPVMLEL
jgi:hypothetical protein